MYIAFDEIFPTSLLRIYLADWRLGFSEVSAASARGVFLGLKKNFALFSKFFGVFSFYFFKEKILHFLEIRRDLFLG